MKTALNKIQEACQNNNNIKDEIDCINKDIEALTSALNESAVDEFAVNLRSLVVRVNKNTKALTSELEAKKELRDKLTKQMEEQEPLMKLIDNVNSNNMSDDELLKVLCESSINLDYLLEDSEPTKPDVSTDDPEPPLPSNIDVINNTTIRVNGKTYVEYNAEKDKALTENTKSIIEDVKSIQQDIKEIQEEDKQAQANVAFEDKAFDIQTKPPTPEDINNLKKAYEMSSDVDNSSPISKNPFNKESLSEKIEALNKAILAKENISNLEPSFITKINKCELPEKYLRIAYRYYFGPVNYILDNLGSTGKITQPLHDKLLEIARASNCAESLTFLLENFSEYIYPNYINKIKEVIAELT